MSDDRWAALAQGRPESVAIGEHAVRRGSRVVLHPPENGDVLTRGLAGKIAVVDALEADLDDRIVLAVVLEDDPARTLGKGAHLAHRFFFAPGEVEPLDDGARAPRILVAGIGNVFLGDDGFGVAVVRALGEHALPPNVSVVDFGIRGLDLAYALGDGYDAALLVDAAPRGGAPGTLEVIAPDDVVAGPIEGHGMDPARVIALARQLGGLPARTLVIGCEPAAIPGDGGEFADALSPPVAAAVAPAVALVGSLVDGLLSALQEVRTP